MKIYGEWWDIDPEGDASKKLDADIKVGADKKADVNLAAASEPAVEEHRWRGTDFYRHPDDMDYSHW